jgi:long-chain acyl-CoA synthetase
MPSAMDVSLRRHLEELTAPGAPFELSRIARYGTELPLFAKAPPSLAHFVEQHCARHGDATFLVDGNIRLSFSECLAAARALAGGLVKGHGVKPGERVGIAARNSANWVVAYMAVLLAGGCATLLNGWWLGAELAEAIELTKCRLVLADEQRAARIEGLDHGAEVLVIAHDTAPADGLSALLAGGGGTETPLPDLGPDDLATILFTSGSTGKAKGVASDHRAVVQATLNFLVQSLAVLAHLFEAGEAPQEAPGALMAVPMFHVTGEVLLLQSFALGRKLVILPRWDPREAMRLIEAERVTYFLGVPLMSHEILAHPERGKFDLSSCASFGSGGAPRPVGHVHEVREALPGAFPIIGYGLTETNAVGCANFNENYLAKPLSTGPASRPLVELAIFDERGEKLPQRVSGEVALRTICAFQGYWGDPDATGAVLRPDGWFLTGDLGSLDEDGYLFIHDRKKDIIIRGGENISAGEVEQAIYAHPDIAECAVFGLPDARFGEVPAAVWIAREGRELTVDELREFLAGRLAPYKIPAHFWRANAALPRLGTEKVDRHALREHYSALSGAQEY